MMSRFSVVLLFLVDVVLYGTLVSTSTSGANSSSQAASPSYVNITSPGDMAATTVGFVSGSAAVESCYLEWGSWLTDQAIWWYSEVFVGGFSTEFATLTSTVYSTYTLCDGIPRIVLDGVLNYTTITVTERFATPTFTYTYESALAPSPVILSTVTTVIPLLAPVSVATLTSTYDQPSPTCQVGPSDCASLYMASSNAMFTGGGINYTASPPLFACETVYGDSPPDIDYQCVVYIPIVQLIYWPVTLASQDLCIYPDPIDVTAPPSGTPVASLFGMNFTSDENCYLSYPIAMAIFFYNDTVQTETGDIVAVASSNLQSFRGFVPGYTDLFTYSFNFADLPPNHVPVLAYEAGASCSDAAAFGLEVEFDTMCATIYEELYAPVLAFPTELINKFPQWASCYFGYEGIYDPPTSLVPVDFLTPPTTGSYTTSASPGWTQSPAPAPVTQAPSRAIAAPVGSHAIAIDSDPGSSGDRGLGSESNADPSYDSSHAPANTDPTPDPVTTPGSSRGSVAISVSNVNGVLVVGNVTVGEIAVGGPAITLSDGIVLSAADNGLVITGAGGITTVSAMAMATSTPPESSASSRPTEAIAVTSVSQTGGSSRADIGMRVLVMWLFVALGFV